MFIPSFMTLLLSVYRVRLIGAHLFSDKITHFCTV